MIKRDKKYCKLSELKVNVGETKLLLNQKITRILSVKKYNLLNYKKQKYRQKSVVEKWYIAIEKRRKERRHSSFFVGLSSICWAINDNFIWELVGNLMSQNRHKLLYYRRGLKGMNTVVN